MGRVHSVRVVLQIKALEHHEKILISSDLFGFMTHVDHLCLTHGWGHLYDEWY